MTSWPKYLTVGTHFIKSNLQCLSLNDFSQETWLCHIMNRKLYSRKRRKKKLTGSVGITPPLKPASGCQKWNKEEIGKRKPLFTQRWVCSLCLAAHDAFNSLYSYSKCWHCGLYFWQSGTCVCSLFFSCPCPFGIVVIHHELHCAEVCQRKSSDTVQFWCQPSPWLALASHGTEMSLLYFKL